MDKSNSYQYYCYYFFVLQKDKKHKACLCFLRRAPFSVPKGCNLNVGHEKEGEKDEM